MNTQTILIIGGVAVIITATVATIALLKSRRTQKDLEDFVKMARERGWIKVEPAETAGAPAGATA